ncbi:aminoacyl-histidine dipeptidase [Nocardioides mangrovicus]|uniref:Aminoacyl-histidine dipeptidase n=2 Tax=Nocardioides mangrovicus TaxID=2478913 RepID=A0A3L8P8B7_9ACTN|nr:aminoacyl-histidine dipeptidase [Nocardioides mangrovicus]
MTVLSSLEPAEILGHFETLAGIPRGSGNEQQVADWVVAFARERGLEAEQDAKHCVLVRKPGQGGLEDAPPLILHGHLDMVCERSEGVVKDFATEPIDLVVDGDYISAAGTSLGADNGIGVSYILALLDDREIAHPPLEAVLTAMEEKGKAGAGQFDFSRLTGTRMIDFNWITDHEILAGCSGDITFAVEVPAEWEDVPGSHGAAVLVKVRGLKGGHCEFDIHLERANALLLLARTLNAVQERYDVRLARAHGGAQNNAIPADAEAVLVVRDEDVEGIGALVAELAGEVRAEYSEADPAVRLEVEPAETPQRVFSAAATQRFSRVTSLVPNGVLSWNLVARGVVESSNNLGTVRATDEGVELTATITSAVTSRKHEVLDRVRSLAALAGGGVRVETQGLDAPEFPYRPDSPLLATAVGAYRDVVGEEPEVHVSQCSLELGFFSRRVPGLDVISIGTELHDLHSPAERVSHVSVAKVWPLVREVVSRLR